MSSFELAVADLRSARATIERGAGEEDVELLLARISAKEDHIRFVQVPSLATAHIFKMLQRIIMLLLVQGISGIEYKWILLHVGDRNDTHGCKMLLVLILLFPLILCHIA